jgi:hypothetical protein
MKFRESPNQQPNNPENNESKAEKLASERNGLLDKVFARILDYSTLGTRDQLGNVFYNTSKEMGPNGKLIVGLAKKAPILGGIINGWEGAAGVDLQTGERLSSKESLIRNMVGTAGAALDVARIIKPGFTIEGKTLEIFRNMQKSNTEKNPDNPSSKAVGAIYNFLQDNKDEVSKFEKQLEEYIRKKNNA